MLSRCWQLSAVPARAHDYTLWCSAGSKHWNFTTGVQSNRRCQLCECHAGVRAPFPACCLAEHAMLLLSIPSACLSTRQPLPWPLGASCPGVLHQPDMGMRSHTRVFSAPPGLLSVAQWGTVSLWKTQPQQHRLGAGRS